MPSSRTRRTVSRSNTPLSPPKASSVTHESPARRSARNKSYENAVASRPPTNIERLLAIVEEEKESTREHSPADSTEVVADGEDNGDDGQEDRLSDVSSIASQQEVQAQLDELDQDLITDCLPTLYLESLQILSLFRTDALPQVLDDIKSDATSSGRRYRSLRARFDLSSQPCRVGQFISVDIVVQKLIEDVASSPDTPRPDAILYLANLAILVSNLVAGEEAILDNTLDVAFNNFPGQPFLGTIVTKKDTDSATPCFGTTFLDATIELGISIRTQFFLRSVAKRIENADFDPDSLLQQTFLDDEQNPRGYEDITESDLLEKITAACYGRIQRIKKFFKSVRSASVALVALQNSFSWQECLVSMIKWAHWRRAELTRFVTMEGGAQAISEKLAGTLQDESMPAATPAQSMTDLSQRPRTMDRASVQSLPGSVDNGQRSLSQATPTAATTSHIMSGKSLSRKIDRLKEYKAQFDQESVTSEDSESENPTKSQRSPLKSSSWVARANTTAATPSEQSQPDQMLALNDENDEDVEEEEQEEEEAQWDPTPDGASRPSLVPSQQTIKVLEAAKRQLIASNKENLGLKKSVHHTETAPESVNLAENVAKNKGKERANQSARKHDIAEVDEDFETDPRQHKKLRFNSITMPSRNNLDVEPSSVEDAADSQETSQEHHSRPPPSAQPNLPRKQSTQSSSSGASSSQQRRPPPSSSAPAARSSHRSRSPLTASQQRDRPDTPPISTQVAQANRLAKMNIRRFTSTANFPHRTAQIRRKWSQDEIERLMDLIEVHETSWTRIYHDDKSHPDGPRLEGRDQVALKDKARNIKMDYLKAGKPLPPGFAHVSMKNSDIRKLQEVGVPVYGGENDDDDGEEEE